MYITNYISSKSKYILEVQFFTHIERFEISTNNNKYVGVG